MGKYNFPKKKKKKFRILLDSAFAKVDLFPNLKKKSNLAHAVHNLGLSPQAEDDEIYQKAVNEKRIVLTINFKHFKKLVRAGKAGILGIEPQLTNQEIDKKVCEFIAGKNPDDYRGKATRIQ